MGARKGRRFVVKSAFPELDAVLRRLGVDERGTVQQAVTDAVRRELPAYMPKRSGHLISTLEKTGPTQLKVAGPYARFLFFGKTKSGAPVDYSTEGNPKAGPNWDRRMAAERGAAIAAEARRAARRAR